ncbi:hypothetical protein BRADI_1g42805v3 [Brachypodium distachyon]|uniref:Uncharacterized protein n=1 Tax=Brachypodium distachyon TaxID=15368 RepID=A0A2K2DP07_BRADI|nr:hypothetical protein BRADI_1g42805v3 [Brachypodium distachyon]
MAGTGLERKDLEEEKEAFPRLYPIPKTEESTHETDERKHSLPIRPIPSAHHRRRHCLLSSPARRGAASSIALPRFCLRRRCSPTHRRRAPTHSLPPLSHKNREARETQAMPLTGSLRPDKGSEGSEADFVGGRKVRARQRVEEEEELVARSGWSCGGSRSGGTRDEPHPGLQYQEHYVLIYQPSFIGAQGHLHY